MMELFFQKLQFRSAKQAFQWRDVADFERKELLKMRVYKSLRQASSALLSVTIVIIILRSVDKNERSKYSMDTGSSENRFFRDILSFSARIMTARIGKKQDIT